MRVLMVAPSLPREGRAATTAFIARQIESLRDLGIAVDVVEADGRSKTKYLRATRDVRRRLRSCDLVHAHYGFCGWVARCQLERPIVVSFLGSDLLDYPARRSWNMVLYRQTETRSNRVLARIVDRVIVKSEEMARTVRNVRPHVIPNGVDLGAFTPRDPAEARRELGWPPGEKRVLFPADPARPRKGFSLARAAVEEASRLLGERLELCTLRDVPHHRVATIMNACDAIVLTSLKEGSPNVVKEAMACNVPVVSVDVGDVAYLLDGVQRCCVTQRDARAVAEALRDVLADPGRSDGRKALQEKGLDAETVARRIQGVYEQLLTEGR